MLLIIFFLLQDAYPDGDRHLMQDSKLFQVCAWILQFFWYTSAYSCPFLVSSFLLSTYSPWLNWKRGVVQHFSTLVCWQGPLLTLPVKTWRSPCKRLATSSEADRDIKIHVPWFGICRGNYQRLEFLGDAILQFLVSKYIYHRFPAYNEGHFSVSILWQ